MSEQDEQEEKEIQKNPNVVLKKYKIISQFLEKEEDQEYKEISLPTPESLQKLCEPQIVKDLLTFDVEKYSSFFKDDILNLDKIELIKSQEMSIFLLILIGFINSENEIYELIDESLKVPEEENSIDNHQNYILYLNASIDYLKSQGKFLSTINDLTDLLRILDYIGIHIPKDNKNTLYDKINKDLFLSNEKNKILILIAPSNNFWIKSEKSSINDQNYDKKLNNYSNIFYNKGFIKKFMEKIANNPRCRLGLLSSMAYRNLNSCWEALSKLDNDISQLCPKNVIFIDQTLHDALSEDPKSKKKTFLRSMDKIKEHLKKKKSKNKDDDQDNTSYFEENNILILESEQDKMSDTTKNNSIPFNVFNEGYLEKDEKGREAIDLDVDKFLNYLMKLFDNCGDDIRSYIKQNPFISEGPKA